MDLRWQPEITDALAATAPRPLNSKPVGFGRISDEQASGLLSLSLHPLSRSTGTGETSATHLGREACEMDAQAVGHSEERITTPIGADKQRDPMNGMRPVYIAAAGRTIRSAL